MTIGARWLCSLGIGASVALTSGCALFEQREVKAPLPATVAHSTVMPSGPWIQIDSHQKKLTVHHPGRAAVVFDGVAFGAAGVREKHRQGDHVTPRGRYKVGWISRQSKFINFIGLNYPSVEDAERGFKQGVITQATFSRIRDSHSGGQTPSQTTPLGGFIGIHGLGRGSLEIHRFANWTEGCIAVDNTQIRQLVDLVTPGMEVEIQ